MAVPLDLVAPATAATGGASLLPMLGLEAGSGLLKLLGGLFGGGPSPEDIYNMRMQLARQATERYFTEQENRLRKRAERDISLARQRGGREAASLGLTASPSAFIAPLESGVRRTLADQLETLMTNKTANLAQIQAQGLNFPIIKGPNVGDYLGEALHSASGVLQTKYAIDNTPKMDPAKYMDDLYNKYLGASMSVGAGQDPIMSSLNRYASLGDSLAYNPSPGSSVGSSPTNWAARYFTYGK